MITSAAEIRQLNMERIRLAIQRHDTCTKADISRETELSMATCSNMLNDMLDEREVLKVDQVGAGIGRPSDLFSYNGNYMHVLCVCVYAEGTANTVDLAVSDALGKTIKSERLPYGVVSADVIEAIVGEQIASDPQIRTVGLGVPGVVSGGSIVSCDIRALQKADVARRLTDRFNVRVLLKGNMTLMTYHLYHGEAGRKGNFAVLYFPPAGFGPAMGGFIVGGRAVSGSGMMSGEIWRAAEAFGMPRAEQERAVRDRDTLLGFAAKLLAAVCCTVDPDCAVLTGGGLDERDASAVRSLCAKHLPEERLPEIRVTPGAEKVCVRGLVRMTLDSVLFPLTA